MITFAAASAFLGLVAPAALAGPSGAPQPGSVAYMQRDLANMEAAYGRNFEQLEEPGYLPAVAADGVQLEVAQIEAAAGRPTEPSVTVGAAIPEGVGNPDRDGWSGTRGVMTAVSFAADDGAVLRGTVFSPLAYAHDPYTGAPLKGPYPSVVFETGSIQSSAGVYRWLGQDLAERGYVVLEFDVQGQGNSDTFGGGKSLSGVPSENQGNFDTDASDAISYELSTPRSPFHGGFNPLWASVAHGPDQASVTPGRTVPLAFIGHSTGAVTVSYLQGVDKRIEVAVALDKITATAAAISDDQAETGSLPGPVVPVVPTLGLQAEYGFEAQPYFLADCSSFEPCTSGSVTAAPNPNREEATGFDTWRSAKVSSMVIVPRASTHLNFTDMPPILPASIDGQAMASYYIQAWLAEYLQHSPAADQLLLSGTVRYLEPTSGDKRTMITFSRDPNLSFYFCSGYAMRLSQGLFVSDGDLTGDGCPAK